MNTILRQHPYDYRGRSIEIEGDDNNVYVKTKRDGYPKENDVENQEISLTKDEARTLMLMLQKYLY